MRTNDGVTFWILRHGTDGRPVAGMTGPAARVADAGLAIQRMTMLQDRMILAACANTFPKSSDSGTLWLIPEIDPECIRIKVATRSRTKVAGSSH
jgi:hypothetical protein